MRFVCFHALVFLCLFFVTTHALNTIWAVNCGGSAHIDVNGVNYQADFNNQGIASDHGLRLVLHRVDPDDMILYQTERFGLSTFYYEFPMPTSGSYVLHLKFSEVWYQESGKKVFSVELNGGLEIIKDLDIFYAVGFSSAHDVNVPIEIKDNKIYYSGASAKFNEGEKLRVTFVKGHLDNPKVNAIALFANKLEDIPLLPPLQFYDAENEKKKIDDPFPGRKSRPSIPPLMKPPAPDPYASIDLTTYILPVVFTLIALLPVILCLYRM